ncbi:MAG: hypothetical protein AAGI11_04745 [Pseudomonadota bacterium]
MKAEILKKGKGNVVEVPISLTGSALQIHIAGNHNHVFIEEGVVSRGGTVRIRGDGNLVRIGAGTRLARGDSGRVVFDIKGDANSLLVGKQCLVGAKIRFMGDHGTIDIGAGTTSFTGAINVRESGTISIGRDCQFAGGFWIADSDMHPIYEKTTGDRLNAGADVVIGEHVWLARQVVVLKGSHIGKGTVVGALSVVSGDIPADSMAVGIPARVVRENIQWERDFAELGRTMTASGQGQLRFGSIE